MALSARYLSKQGRNQRLPLLAPWSAKIPCGRAVLRLLLAMLPLVATARAAAQVHGVWVWKGPEIAQDARGPEALRDFCVAQGVNETYIAVSAHGEMMPADSLTQLIALLHGSGIRVEALLSSEDADEAGPHREKLLGHVREVIAFNRDHRNARFDGIHLDIEPQQRPENKGAGNLRFLPGLVDAYKDVRVLAEPAHLTVNADIQNKLLKGSLEERRSLLMALPQLTLMLYELSSPGDGQSTAQKMDKLRMESGKYLAMAYDGLGDTGLAGMVIGLRTPDYGDQLPAMLKALDEANAGNPHYLGSARHSYNDMLDAR